MSTVAYIGLGSMGSAMASRAIDRGHTVHVFDLDHELVAAMVARGAIASDDAASAGAAADVVSICVPAASHVAAVLVAMGAALRPGLTVLVHSTIGPEEVHELAEVAAAAGAHLHDASIAGGADSAAVGEVVLLVGGLAGMADDARALCADYARSVVDAGPVGTGAVFKLAMNVMTYAQFAATHIGHGVVTAAGGDPRSLLQAWRDIGMLGALADRYSLIDTLPEDSLAPMRPFLQAQAENARKDLRLAGGLAGVDATERHWLDALQAAMPGIYRYDGELEDRE